MIDPWIELAGWMIARAISDVCGEDGATREDGEDALDFLKNDPFVDDVLDCIQPGSHILHKRRFILEAIIPQRMKAKTSYAAINGG